MKRLLITFACIAALCSCTKQETLSQIADRVYSLAAVQLKTMAPELAPGVTPVHVENGEFIKSDAGSWVSGFYPGSLWLAYEYTKDEELKALADRFTMDLDSLVKFEPDHDLGFRVNCSYGNAYRITGDEKYLPMLKWAAETLADRFNPVVGCTRSWNHGKWEYPVIIDNMMNLELLYNATGLFDDVNYDEICDIHAQTTMKNHFREDYSTWHLVNYSTKDGSVLEKQTVQGYSDDSMWARGEAWALYGYTMMYRESGNEIYLRQACNIADLLLKRLPEDGIPYWDFDCKDIPDTERDASAGCIMASAFLELAESSGNGAYRQMAEKQIRTLAGPEYLAQPGEQFGFILRHSVGNYPGGDQIDVPLTYADYYFLEALSRL